MQNKYQINTDNKIKVLLTLISCSISKNRVGFYNLKINELVK